MGTPADKSYNQTTDNCCAEWRLFPHLFYGTHDIPPLVLCLLPNYAIVYHDVAIGVIFEAQRLQRSSDGVGLCEAFWVVLRNGHCGDHYVDHNICTSPFRGNRTRPRCRIWHCGRSDSEHLIPTTPASVVERRREQVAGFPAPGIIPRGFPDHYPTGSSSSLGSASSTSAMRSRLRRVRLRSPRSTPPM